ncbi:hypothetical protein ABPG75_009674 [Micractinium tetrahymenae]
MAETASLTEEAEGLLLPAWEAEVAQPAPPAAAAAAAQALAADEMTQVPPPAAPPLTLPPSPFEQPPGAIRGLQPAVALSAEEAPLASGQQQCQKPAQPSQVAELLLLAPAAAVAPMRPDAPASFSAANMQKVLLAREHVVAAAFLEQLLQGAYTGMSLLPGLVVRLKKGAYLLREIASLGCDGKLHFKHDPLRCDPGAASGSKAEPSEDELQELQRLHSRAEAPPWTALQVATLLWHRHLIDAWVPRLQRDAATGAAWLHPDALAQLAAELADPDGAGNYLQQVELQVPAPSAEPNGSWEQAAPSRLLLVLLLPQAYSLG